VKTNSEDVAIKYNAYSYRLTGLFWWFTGLVYMLYVGPTKPADMLKAHCADIAV